MKNFKIFLILLCMTMIFTERIEPNFNFPVLFRFNTKATGNTTLELRFKLPTATQNTATRSGITYGQFIGVRFPIGVFDFSSNLVPTVSLMSGTTNYTVAFAVPTISPITATNTAEPNVLYIQYLDKTVNLLPTNTNLVLSIRFPSALSITFIHNIGIFTSTSNNRDQVIIDNLPSIGTLGLYRDYTLDDNNKIMIVNNSGSSLSTIVSPAQVNNNTTLYPGFTININFRLELQQYWIFNAQDMLMYVKYATTSFSYPTSVTTSAFSSAANEGALTESLGFIEVSDGIIITGFVNNLVYPRKFVMNLNGVKTTDVNLKLSTNLEILILYRNTYSVISYSRVAMDVVNVIPLQDAKVIHPDYFPVFDGMGWPFQFQFRSNVEISNGGFVVIRQRDYSRATQAVTLVASSCDFSLTNLEQNFGKRFNCLPLRNDFNYDIVADTLEANGIFFKMPNIIASTTDTYKIRVWGFIEKCYNSSNGVNSYFRELTFTIRIFKRSYVNDTYKNESIFPVTTQSTSTNYVLAEATSVVLENKCYPLQYRGANDASVLNGTDPYKIPYFVEVDGTAGMIANGTEHLFPIGIEVHNIFIMGVPSTLTTLNAIGGTTFFARYSAGIATGAETKNSGLVVKYIFSSTADIANTSVLFFATIPVNGNSTNLYTVSNYIPTECTGTGVNAAVLTNQGGQITANYVEATIRWLFNRQWFTSGNSLNPTGTADGCQLNWEFYSDQNTAIGAPTNLDKPTTLIIQNNIRSNAAGTVPSVRKTSLVSKNYTITLGNTNQSRTISANINTENSKINTLSTATGNDLTYRISSNAVTFDGTATLPNLGITGQPCDASSSHDNNAVLGATATLRLGMGFYSDCIKWSSKPSNSTWMYTYFDVQLQIINKNAHPLRVIRFIKLYPELGVFQDPTTSDILDSTSGPSLATNQKWIVTHMNPTWSGSSPFNVCLIEINSNVIDKKKQTSSNVLIMWLFATSLLDLDPNNESFEYPVSPLPSNTAYANNSGQTISANFRLIGDPQSSTNFYPDLSHAGAIVNSNITILEILLHKLVFHSSVNYLDTTPTSLSRASYGFEHGRSIYHIFMGSVIYIPTTNNPSGDVNRNLYVPYLCPTYSAFTATSTYPSNGIYFTNPIVTLAWGQMSAYNNITRIDTYIRPNTLTTVANSIETITGYSLISNVSGVTTIPFPISTLLTKDPILDNTVNDAGDTKPLSQLWRSGGNLRSTLNLATDNYPSSRKSSFLDLKVNFRAYTKNTNNEQNILDLTSLTASNASCIMIFLSSKISDILSTGVTGNPNIAGNIDRTFKYKKVNNLFYIMGIPFNKFLAWAYHDPNGVILKNTVAATEAAATLRQFPLSTSHVIPITGIPRLDITNYENSELKKTNYFNYVAVFTARSTADQTTNPTTANKSQSNIILNESSGTLASFIGFKLYLPTLDDTTSWNPSIREDDTDNFITNEKSGNVNVSGTFPTLIPRGTYVKLSFDNSIITSVTKCGMIELGKTNQVTDCDISSADVSCPITKNASTFEICCYNIANDNIKIAVDRAEINFNLSLSGFTSSLYNQSANSSQTTDVFYKRPSATEISSSNKFALLNFNQRIVTDLSSSNANFFSSLTQLRYSYSNTVNGIGLAHLQVRMPRSATRGMTLSIISNFSNLKPNSLRSRLVATFGNSLLFGSSMDTGDAFIDSIYTDFTTNGIILKLKNMVYKCNIKLSNTLNIFIWPVFTVNVVNQSVKITMKGADNSDLANSNAHNISSTPVMTFNLVEENVLADFCKISNVDPRLPGVYAEYSVSLNFQQTSSKIEASGVTGNEIILYFDHIAYGDYQNVVCYNENNLLPCTFIEDSILSIRFSNINTSGDSNQILRIVGIVNPNIPANNNNVFFGCALSSTNFNTEVRRFMVRGVTSISEGIEPKNDTVFGNIIFKNFNINHRINIPNTNQTTNANIEGSAQGEEPLNPLENPSLLISSWENSYTISFSLDVANKFISNWENGFTLGNGIELYITFPEEFKFHYYSLSNIRATLVGYRMNELNQSVIEIVNFDSSSSTNAETSVKITEIKIIGNQLRLKLSNTSLVFNKFFQYFVLKIFNIPPPENNTSDTSTGKITTKAFEILMMNTNRTQIFKTWTNLNNWSQQDVLVNKINDFLPRNKGLKFEYDQKKWVIDSIDKSGTVILLNDLMLRAGRFMTYHFRIRNSSRLLEPKVVRITVSHNKIRYDRPSYEVATYRFTDIPFKIGVPCNEPNGYLIARPVIQTVTTENLYNFFMPLANIVFWINNSEISFISSPLSVDVRINGSTFVDFTVTLPPVEDININFISSTQSEILNSRLLSNSLRVRTVFRMLDKNTDNLQSFLLPILDNNCYEFKEDKINFVVNKVAAIIPNSALRPEMFTYLNSETESTLTPNSVAFRFNSVYSQIYMYAVLTCYDFEFPSIESMKNNNITQSETLRFYYEILNNEGTHTLIFRNVLRGYPMKLRVFIESTQGVLTERTASDNIILLNSTLTNGTVIPIIATRTRNPRCASYQFKTRPGTQVTNPLLWYWQRRYSLSGYYESGCISAVDQYGTIIPGLPNIRNETNCGTAKCRFIDRTNFVVNATQLAIPETYTICAYPLSSCETDPTNYQEIFNEIMVTLSNNQTFNNTLNTRVVPEFVLLEVDDNLKPDTPVISDIKTTTNSLSFSGVSTRPVRCFSRISNQGAPTDAEFNSCNSSNCKVLEISKLSSSYTFSGLSAGSYTIYAKCYNDMHCSQSSSGVISLGSGTVSSPSNNNNQTNNNTTPTKSQILNLSYIFILVILVFFE